MPIQCAEAVYMAIYLSTIIPQVDRVPLSFKSRLVGQNTVFRHIVLAVRYQGKWGALGLSRRRNLMWKEITYDSLYELVQDYKLSYESVFHELLAVYLGLPIPHDTLQNYPVKWKAARVSLHQDYREIETQLNSYAANMNKLVARATLESSLPRL